MKRSYACSDWLLIRALPVTAEFGDLRADHCTRDRTGLLLDVDAWVGCQSVGESGVARRQLGAERASKAVGRDPAAVAGAAKDGKASLLDCSEVLASGAPVGR